MWLILVVFRGFQAIAFMFQPYWNLLEKKRRKAWLSFPINGFFNGYMGILYLCAKPLMYAHIYMDPQQEDKFISTSPWDHTEHKNVSHLHVVFFKGKPSWGLKLALPTFHRHAFYLGVWHIFAVKMLFGKCDNSNTYAVCECTCTFSHTCTKLPPEFFLIHDVYS